MRTNTPISLTIHADCIVCKATISFYPVRVGTERTCDNCGTNLVLCNYSLQDRAANIEVVK